jgi:antirestriction protein
MLAESPTAEQYSDIAEEWAIHDYEGFGELRLGEYESLRKVAKIASGIEKHGLAFSAWISHVGERSDELIDQFEDRFQGRWESRQAYAEYMLGELGAGRVVDEAPEWLRGYLSLDVAGFAHDLELGGDIEVVDASDDDGGVWVWSGH